MLLKTEYYTDEHGNEMKKEYYGKDEEHISATICCPAKEYEPPQLEPELSETEQAVLDTNANVTYMMCAAELNGAI